MTAVYYYRDPPDRPLMAEEVLAVAFWMAQHKKRHGGGFWGLPPTVRESLIKHAQTALFFAEEMGARVILQQMSEKEIKTVSKKLSQKPKAKKLYMTKRRREALARGEELPIVARDYKKVGQANAKSVDKN